MSRPLAQLLQTGARVGRYEIQGPLGAGGMGVVYRAWDPQLGRDVAVKLLDQLLPHSHEQQERFRREMRMASALNHPNVLAVFDAGEHGGSLYLVTELLVGQSLRAALRTQLPPLEQALDWGRQITRGLAAIHAHGIVHRDLKPENVFIREDGTVKILDFGIARAPAGSPGTTLTDSGAVLGTSGYMSPEQVRGTPADTRSDVFALGTLLYELLGGRPAFSGASPIECAYAVLNRDPAALPPSVPAQVRRVVQQCLAKDPEGRYRTANDVRLALEALADAPAGAGRPRSRWMLAPPGRRARRGLQLAALVLLALALALAGVQAWRPVPRGQEGAQLTLPPHFTRVTFRRGVGYAGRFGPEAQSVVFSASIGGKPTQTFLSLRGSPETRPIFDAGTSLVAVSARGKVVLRIPRLDEDERLLGEGLALSSLSGDTPKLLAPELTMVDFIPGTDELAGVRRTGEGFQLELPLGKVVLPLKRRVGGLRVSPDGQRVAWIALPEVPGLGATIEVVDRQGQQRSLTGPLDELNGIAWDSRGEEVWFANRVDGAPSKDFELVAVSLEGQTRRVAVLPYWVVLHDIAKDGRVLLMWGAEEHRVAGRFPPAQHEVDLSWFDLSDAVDISSDGRQLLLGDSEGDGVGAYVRGTQGEAAVRLAHGWPLALAPKGDRALLLRRRLAVARVDDLWLVPTGAGEDRPVSIHPVRTLRGVFFFPDGESLLVVGMALGREPRIWLHRLKTGETTPLTEEGVMTAAPPSADGTRIVATSIDTGKSVLRSVRDGTETALPGLRPGDVPVHWAADGKSLFVRRLHVPGLPWEVPRSALISRPPPAVMLRYDLQQHRLHPWRELRPEGAVDIAHMDRVLINGDGSGYAYSYGTEMTNLFIVEGLR